MGPAQDDGDDVSRDEIEDLCPLSPMQLGMMFHSLAEPGTGSSLDFQFRRSMGPDRTPVRSADRNLPSRHEDG